MFFRVEVVRGATVLIFIDDCPSPASESHLMGGHQAGGLSKFGAQLFRSLHWNRNITLYQSCFFACTSCGDNGGLSANTSTLYRLVPFVPKPGYFIAFLILLISPPSKHPTAAVVVDPRTPCSNCSKATTFSNFRQFLPNYFCH